MASTFFVAGGALSLAAGEHRHRPGTSQVMQWAL